MTIHDRGAVAPAATPGVASKLYFAAWRWHFYAGLYVIPFLLLLSATGALILWFTAIAPEYGDRMALVPGGRALEVSQQVAAAEATHPGSRATRYVAPLDPAKPALVRLAMEGGARMLAVNPYDGQVLADRLEAGTWNDWLTDLHGTLFLGGDGGPGDVMIEIAASLGLLMIATGLYLHWPRGGGLRGMLVPRLSARGRAFWKALHGAVGSWLALVLAFFLVSGLAWASIWGGMFVQAWNTFPAEKWGAPLSDKTHASLNETAVKEVPWALELSPLPESGSQAGVRLIPEGLPVTWDTVLAGARALGFDGRVQVNAPAGATGVWTLSRDSMSYDSADPMADRTVHLDRYTGRVLADVRFDDYPLGGRAMAVGVALHEGQLGLWNVALNLGFVAAIWVLCLSGLVLWWKRRPAGAMRLAAPPRPEALPYAKGAILVTLALALAFPVLGLVILALAALDLLVLSPIAPVRRLLN